MVVEDFSISLYFLGRMNACMLKFWHMEQGIRLYDLQLRMMQYVAQAVVLLRRHLLFCTSLQLCILSFSRLMVATVRVFSIDVKLLVCRQSFITNQADRLCALSNFWMLTLVNGSQTIHAYSSNGLTRLCSIHPLFFVTVQQVSLNKGPGRVGLLCYVFNACSS